MSYHMFDCPALRRSFISLGLRADLRCTLWPAILLLVDEAGHLVYRHTYPACACAWLVLVSSFAPITLHVTQPCSEECVVFIANKHGYSFPSYIPNNYHRMDKRKTCRTREHY